MKILFMGDSITFLNTWVSHFNKIITIFALICNKMMMQKSNNNTKKSNYYRRNILLEDTRRESLGEWLYNHRIGVMVVILTLLVGGTWLATARYSFTIPPMEYFVEFVEEVPSEAEVAELKAAQEKLTESAQKVFAKMYEQAQAAQQAGGAGPDMSGFNQAGPDMNAGNSADDDVIDADFKEV